MGRSKAFDRRIHEVDFIRGILIIFVILDHLFWFLKVNNLSWYNSNNIEFFNVMYRAFDFYWRSGARQIVRQIVLFGFVFISGISCAFSKNNWARAGQMILVWGILAILTNIGDKAFNGSKGSWIIDFNVIGVLAWSILIYCFFQKWSWKGLTAIGLICFLFTIVVLPCLLNIEGMKGVYLPAMWAPLPDSGHTGDWMPLFPYICYFFFGAVAATFIYPDKKSLFKRYEWERPICFTGRNTIWVYLFHEPILIGLFALLTLIFGAL